MSGICDTYDGSIKGEVFEINPGAIQSPDTLVIMMTRGERRIARELRDRFGGLKRVVIDVDGERHEFSADSLIRLLEGYEGAPCTRYAELFGTPERAARTSLYMLECNMPMSKYVNCDECPIKNGCAIATDIDCDDGEAALLEWLRGDAE